jgi:hypothetical protein
MMAGAVEAMTAFCVEAGACPQFARASSGFASVSSQIIRRLRINGFLPVAGTGN